MLGGQGLEVFMGDVKRWERYRKNGDIRTVNKKDISEKPHHPPVPARINIYSVFLKILKILDFIAKIKHFLSKKKLFFGILVDKNSKFRQSETAIS